MSEPIHFNTNIIFYFGTDGIIDFGGEEDGMIDVSSVTWSKKDIETAYKNLNELSIKLSLTLPNFDNFEVNKSGTLKMLGELVSQNHPANYILGCIICHQLKYKIPLEATFQTGEPNNFEYTLDNSE